METIALTIDGRKIISPAGTSILEAAEQNGIKIPRLCHHPDLKPFGACRMCLVEDEKSGRLMANTSRTSQFTTAPTSYGLPRLEAGTSLARWSILGRG